MSADFKKYRKIPKISPGAYIFKGPFWWAHFWRGLCTEVNLRFEIDWASLLLGRKFTVFLCFILYLKAISKYKPPRGGAYIWRGDLSEGFCYVTSLGGLYLEGLICGILWYSSSVGRYLSPWHGQAILVSGYTVLTVVIDYNNDVQYQVAGFLNC